MGRPTLETDWGCAAMPSKRYGFHLLRRLRSARSRRGERLGEAGATAVEAALILPVLFVLTFGIIEVALLVRDYAATAQVVRAGVRIAAVLPRDTTMVDATLKAVERESSALPKSAYRELWIYDANPAGYPGADGNRGFNAADCKAANNCAIYRWDATAGKFTKSAGGFDSQLVNACPGEADSVGIYLLAEHKWITGMFAKTTPVSDRVTMRFEPIGFCKS